MKIGLVVHDFDPGVGHGRYTVELARRFALRHEVHILANRFAVGAMSGVTFHPVRAWRRCALGTILTFLPASQLQLRRLNCDVVHAQGLTCWRADVITAHVCNRARRELDPPKGWRHRLFSSIVTPLEAGFYRANPQAKLIAISRCVGAEIRRYYGWPGVPTTIYHGTDTDHFTPPRSPEQRILARVAQGYTERDWVWLFIGEASKGLAAAISLLPSFPCAKLLAVSRSALDRYRHQVRELRLEDRVLFRGAVDDLAPVYHSADAFIYPSKYDTFGLVAAEAMACGLPVILGRNIGAAEWIVDRQNGLLCEPRNSATLTEALHWLRADRKRAIAMGQAARQTVQGHGWDACATATLAVYEASLAARAGRKA